MKSITPVFSTDTIIVLLILIHLIYIYLSCRNKKEEFTTFSKTQFLGNEPKDVYEQGLDSRVKKIYDKISKIDFPNIDETKKEVEILIGYQNTKDLLKHKIQAIKELHFEKDFEELKVEFKDREKIDEFFNITGNPILFKLKIDYNRIRPSYFDKRVKAVISVPLHPSYPSGHSFQAYFIAYALIKKYPNKKSFYLKYAKRVAQNREIMGLHYPSDSEYGKKLAHELIEYTNFKL